MPAAQRATLQGSPAAASPAATQIGCLAAAIGAQVAPAAQLPRVQDRRHTPQACPSDSTSG